MSLAAFDDAPLRVLIADDADLMRTVLRHMLTHSGDFVVVAEAADGGAAVELATLHHPDVVLLDLAMPVVDGLEAIPRIRAGSPGSKIVVLSGFNADRMEHTALEVGADAYLEKRYHPDDLLARLRAICQPAIEDTGDEDGAEHPIRPVPAARPTAVHPAALSAPELARFAEAAAHELRSPLQVVQGFASLLERTHADVLDDAGRDMLTWVLNGAAQLDARLDSLVAYARVGTSATPPVPVDLGALMRRTAAAFADRVSETAATITWYHLPQVTGQPDDVAALLHHLVDNALTFVAAGTVPEIHVASALSKAGRTISITDNGVGIALEDRERVFEPWTRLGARSGRDGGGMGLAICRRVVESMGGRIWIEAAPGGGTAVMIEVQGSKR